MEQVRFGNTDLRVSRIGFGCEPLGGCDWGQVDEPEAVKAVHRALDLGINFFDTADIYGLGRSEEVLSKALGERRRDVIIATKFGVNWVRDPKGGRAKTFYDSSPKRAIEALEGSLRRLRIDTISVYQVNWPDPDTPIADTMEALVKCQAAGKIRCIGLCNFPAPLIREAHNVSPLASLQAKYNLLDRQIEGEILGCCAELGLAVLAWGSLAQGLLSGKYGPESRFGNDDRRSRLEHFQGEKLAENLKLVDKLREIGARYGKTPAQVAVRWVLTNPLVTCAIVGAKKPVQVEENAEATGWNLSEPDRESLTR